MKYLLGFCLLFMSGFLSNAQQMVTDSSKLVNENRILKSRLDSLESRLNALENNAVSIEEQIRFRREFLAMQTDLTETQFNLFKTQKEYRTGTICLIAGLGLLLIGELLPAQARIGRRHYTPATATTGATSTASSASVKEPVMILGGISAAAGLAFHIHSHRFIVFAGRKYNLKNIRYINKD